ncbi:MAG: hypothetical protein H7Y38_14685 [Armatimonadetes bacterium]|nr:hypothetical protein [Armatimonadota bacterium]
MAYESFTLSQVETQFELTLTQTRDAYAQIAPIAPSKWLKQSLRFQSPLVVGRTSDKRRSEFLVAPILVEMREIKDETVALFSGVKFDVDKKAGLHGYCDFLMSRDALLNAIKAPALFVTGAKKEDLNAGVPQCIAEMVAAQRFNDAEGKPIETVYGAVTDGTRRRFLSQREKIVGIDLREYGIAELPQILGILVHMVS